ncbi:hypothetical protein MKJ01_05540 [Chryseobacterium sp. SSA4.19]|uniref:hypothetical protein n=1 Tax=Chryseobacterium sp. SSA4.19 TaxID=2919915 RepID=UPI001F4E7C65|nr:hypothetical protein [Chryseobacterium sp. SSA4.19]MCJ8153223.1 hypothetical protein [Chryseobacterium sp. SSA4.19]
MKQNVTVLKLVTKRKYFKTIQQEAKEIVNKTLKKVDNLKLKINPVERLKIAELIVKGKKEMNTDAVYTYSINQIREKLEKLYETGNYS